MSTSMTSAAIIAKAKEILWSNFPSEFMDASIGQTGPDAFDFLVEVPVPGHDPQEVFVTVKLTAHKFAATSSADPYDGFSAVQEYKDDVAAKAAEKAAKAKDKEAKLKAKAEKAKAKAKPQAE